MRTRAGRVAFALALAATVACSLTTDLSGFSEAVVADATAPDASLDRVVVADVIPDVAPDVALPPCKAALVIDTPLTATLGTWTTLSRSNDSYPKVATFFGSSAAVLFPFVDTTPVPIDAGPDADGGFTIPPERKYAVGGIWQTSPVALRSFDVDFEIQVRCTSGLSCGDGAAFAWLDTSSYATIVSSSNYGGVHGLPSAIGGAAVFFDNFQNSDPGESSDPPVPALEIVQVDATKAIGTYPWVVASKAASFAGAWRTVSISLRNDALTVRYEGSPALSAKVTPLVRGLVGFTAGTGDDTDAVGVRNVKATFYDCAP